MRNNICIGFLALLLAASLIIGVLVSCTGATVTTTMSGRPSGQTLIADSRLVGGGFGGWPPYGNYPYTLEISGEYEDGTAFGFSWEPPSSP